jgi:hypothetical protein
MIFLNRMNFNKKITLIYQIIKIKFMKNIKILKQIKIKIMNLLMTISNSLNKILIKSSTFQILIITLILNQNFKD